ncbi:putative serine/threonine-protein kinase-like protein CCR3 [Malania oleifera]|uniref:putative serine/threonine-protein kinase-like protein CCR3 n=1 Tax=Malania oleifera TaxID=397392 RepID=UPI0025ADFE70|nr:putative serine/threonine-protein kinase-like protein CCR3 [Malania oleifera]
MTTKPHSSVAVAFAVVVIGFIWPPVVLVTKVNSLGSGSTIAVGYGSATVCGIVAGEPTQRIQCYQAGQTIPVQPTISYEAISGGRTFFCGLTSGGLTLLCWDTSCFQARRIYHSETVRLTDLTVGDAHVCAIAGDTGEVKCWRGDKNITGGPSFPSPAEDSKLRYITSGTGFSCGILKNNSRVLCWGESLIGAEIQRQFGSSSMSTLVAGATHACGLNKNGFLVCKGDNISGQLEVPPDSAFEFSGLALGANRTCAIREKNGFVLCWGEETKTSGFANNNSEIENISFESIVAGLDFTCGLATRDLSLVCWGPGWSSRDPNLANELQIPSAMVIPGPCVQSSCNNCGVYPNSGILCYGSGNICNSCDVELPIPIPLPLPTLPHSSPSPPQQVFQSLSSRPSTAKNRLLMAFAIIGSIGAFAGICTGISGFLHKRIHNSADPPRAMTTFNCSHFPTLARQKSGTSLKHAERAENFSLSELAAATDDFSPANKIGGGSFGTVYRGTLAGGREVAIKRGEMSSRRKKFQDKESAFDSELALLSRLHHKHLVSLVGFCHENEERLLVYEFMSNGALHDHLHSKQIIDKTCSILNSWKMRIKIALDAARGIEYLHNYAVPTIIHRDIKSSNILLDANWTARVSDFGLSLMGPESDQDFMSTKAVGTVGYIDPEYYVMNVLTTKSDVYSLGVVLLELLTGKRAVFRNEEGGSTGPMGVVEYAVPRILAGELHSVLDGRVGPPETGGAEEEGVELVAYTAVQCVSLEGKERPSVTDIATNLERALALCEEDGHSSVSNAAFSIPSD